MLCPNREKGDGTTSMAGFVPAFEACNGSDVLISNMVICRIMLCGSQNGRRVGYFQVRLMILEGAAVLELQCLEVVGCRSVRLSSKALACWWRAVLGAVCRGIVAGHEHFSGLVSLAHWCIVGFNAKVPKTSK